jgi:hypothetical protein
MARRFLTSLLACAIALAPLVPAHAAPPKDRCTDGFAIPIDATSVDQGSFTGMLRITRFARSGDTAVAVGLLTGTLTDETGAVSAIARTVALPVLLPTSDPGNAMSGDASAQGVVVQQTCDVLHLTLGPLHLDLLGLIVDLNQVQLDITADPAGGLLGALLCAIAGLLVIS